MSSLVTPLYFTYLVVPHVISAIMVLFYFVLLLFSLLTLALNFITACWKSDTHERPSFHHILQILDDITRSNFNQMPDDSFYTLQEDWKVEIDQILIELRNREKVRGRLKHRWALQNYKYIY